ncbi:MAG: GAF domain-containing protein [Thermoplasmata archaeon]
MFDERNLGETQILAALIGVSEMVSNLSDLSEVLRTVVRISPQLVKVDRAAVFLDDPRNQLLIPAVAYCPRDAFAQVLMDRQLSHAEVPKLVNKVITQKLPSVVRDLPQEDLLPQKIIRAWQLKSMLIVPLVYKGKAVGLMTLDSTTSRHYFTSKEINVVSGIGNQMATAVENARLQDESHRAFRKLEDLAESLADAAIKVDGEMRVRGLSPPSAKFLGWKEDQLHGKPWARVLKAKDDRGRLLAEMDFVGKKPLVNGEMSEGLKAFFTKASGTKVYCHIRALALRGRGEQPSRLYFVFKKAAIPKKRTATPKKKAVSPKKKVVSPRKRQPPKGGKKGRRPKASAAKRRSKVASGPR